MTLPKQKMREAVLQLLFSFDLGEKDEEYLITLLMQQLKATRKNMESAYHLAEAIWSHKKEIDKAISALSHAFTLGRIHKTELQILRIGFYEMLYQAEEIPFKVSIAEGIRLARKFATPAAGQFINALLDNERKKIEGEKIDLKEIEAAFLLHEKQSDCEKNRHPEMQ